MINWFYLTVICIWLLCTIVAIFNKDGEVMVFALILTFLLGVGKIIS